MPTFDPTKPATSSPIASAELRDQLNTLNDRLTALETLVNGVFTNTNSLDTLTTAFANPPTTANLEDIRSKLNELISALYS